MGSDQSEPPPPILPPPHLALPDTPRPPKNPSLSCRPASALVLPPSVWGSAEVVGISPGAGTTNSSPRVGNSSTPGGGFHTFPSTSLSGDQQQPPDSPAPWIIGSSEGEGLRQSSTSSAGDLFLSKRTVNQSSTQSADGNVDSIQPRERAGHPHRSCQTGDCKKTAPLVFLNYNHTKIQCLSVRIFCTYYLKPEQKKTKRSHDSEQSDVHVSTNSSHET